MKFKGSIETKQIELTNSDLKVFVSEVDFDRVNQFKWRLNKSRGYTCVEKTPNESNRYRKLSRYILSLKNSKMVVDHIDGDTFNNQRGNLRICTKQQNSWNSKSDGIIYELRPKRKSFWRARITINYKTIHLGYFMSREEAINARNEASIKYYGKYHRNIQL